MADIYSDIGQKSLERFDELAASIEEVQHTVSGSERMLQGTDQRQIPADAGDEADTTPDEQFAKVSKWLSPRLYGESEQKQREARSLAGRQDGFARSVRTSAAFQSWSQMPGRILWCHGLRESYDPSFE
jgi:hypothetical protein